MNNSEAITKAEKWLATHHAEAFKRGDHETLRIVEHLSRLTALQDDPAPVGVNLPVHLIWESATRHQWFALNGLYRIVRDGNKSKLLYRNDVIAISNHDPASSEAMKTAQNHYESRATIGGVLSWDSALQPSPAREDAEALVKRLRQRALARISLKKARAQDYSDAQLDNDAAAFIAREILGEKPCPREAVPQLIGMVRECHANINLKADFIEATINDSAALYARATAAEARVKELEKKLREEENTRLKQVGELAGELGRVRGGGAVLGMAEE